MRNSHPRFSFNCYRDNNTLKQRWCITADGRNIYDIISLDNFYRVFGYTHDLALAGADPEEFIWSEYTKGLNLHQLECLQMHFVEYLVKNSAEFMNVYGHQYQIWFDDHIAAMSEGNNAACVTCKTQTFCQIGMPR